MRKTVTFGLILVGLLGVALFVANKPQEPTEEEKEAVLGSVSGSEKSIDVVFEGYEYTVAWEGPFAGNQVTLYPNYNDKLGTAEILELKNCTTLVNGGFYSEDGMPIGLFIYDGNQLSDFSPNKTMNGVFSVNDFDTPRVTREVPADHLRLALQSGPVLIENDFAQNVISQNEKQSRRMVAATTGANEVYFLAIYDPASAYIGPNLSNLPEILESFESESGIDFADAINLDGGSASAFITPNINLSELTRIGSYFCVN